MREFTYTVQSPTGLHARPAGMLAKTAKSFEDTAISVSKDDKTVKATQLMMLMALGIGQGDEVTVRAEGASEDAAIEAIESLFQEHL